MKNKLTELNILLANLTVANENAYTAHWNVKNKFQVYHEWFAEIADYYLKLRDKIAERISFYKVPVDGRLSYLLSIKEISEWDVSPDSEYHIQNIIKDMDVILDNLRRINKHSEPDDIGLMSIVGEAVEKIEKLQWKTSADDGLQPIKTRPMIRNLLNR